MMSLMRYIIKVTGLLVAMRDAHVGTLSSPITTPSDDDQGGDPSSSTPPPPLSPHLLHVSSQRAYQPPPPPPPTSTLEAVDYPSSSTTDQASISIIVLSINTVILEMIVTSVGPPYILQQLFDLFVYIYIYIYIWCIFYVHVLNL